MRNHGLLVLLLALFGLAPVPAIGQDDCADLRQTVLDASDDLVRTIVLKRMVDQGCLGGPGDDWSLAQTLDERLASAADHADAAAGVATSIAQRARAAMLDTVTPETARAFQSAAARLAELAEALRRADLEGDLTDADSWRPGGDFSVPALGDIELQRTFILEPCRRDPPSCRAGLREAMELLRLAHAAGRVVANVTTRASELRLSVELRRNDQRWEAYFTEARSQFPLELAANSYLYARNKDEYCDARGGFCAPPAHQWILLHPGVALEYIDDAAEGNRLEPAVVLELIGYNRWKWEGARMGTAIGGSIIAIASDRAGEDDVGYGAMFHYNHKWSLGVTRHGDATGVFLSYELWDTAESKVDALRERFAEFEQLGSE